MSVFAIFYLYVLPLMIIAVVGVFILVNHLRERHRQKHHPAE